MENGYTREDEKQWLMRNSDRKDTFEAQAGGPRVGEVREIDHQDHELPTKWSVAGQTSSDGTILSEPPLAIYGQHVWPSDVSPPPLGTMVLASVQQEPESWAGNGYADEPVQVLVETWNLAADG